MRRKQRTLVAKLRRVIFRARDSSDPGIPTDMIATRYETAEIPFPNTSTMMLGSKTLNGTFSFFESTGFWKCQVTDTTSRSCRPRPWAAPVFKVGSH